MIHQHDLSEKKNLEIIRAFKALKIPKLLRDSNIRKSEGYRARKIFELLLLLVFESKNLFRMLQGALIIRLVRLSAIVKGFSMLTLG